MVNFNTVDYNLHLIAQASRLGELKANKNTTILIYGSRLIRENPMIKINLLPKVRLRNLKAICRLLRGNGLSVRVTRSSETKRGGQVEIGLRRDLREKEGVTFAASLVQTLVYAMEGILKIPAGYTLPNAPKPFVFPPRPKTPRLGSRIRVGDVTYAWNRGQNGWNRLDNNGIPCVA